MSGVKRSVRMAEALREELGRLILFELKDPRVSGVIVTAVRLSDDLREARVYFVLEQGPDGERVGQAERGLRQATGFLRQKIGKAIRARSSPNLHFQFDESIERGAHMEALLKEIRGDQS